MGSSAPDRCSSVSLALDEPLLGTASTVTSWMLVEQPGPWGEYALERNRLPPDAAAAIRLRCRQHRIRAILIRRWGGFGPEGRRVYLAHTGEREPWLEAAVLPDPADLSALLDADLAALGRGGRPGLGEPMDRPLYLVCTNGGRDPCCAERGRPLFRALEPALADRIWECSHIGGDRFAGNLVCMPSGVYFGRVRPEEALSIARAHDEGRLDLDHYRGRTCYPFAVQAAESFLRRELGLEAIAAVTLRSAAGDDGALTAGFDTPAGERTVRVRVEPSPDPRRLTCHGQP